MQYPLKKPTTWHLKQARVRARREAQEEAFCEAVLIETLQELDKRQSPPEFLGMDMGKPGGSVAVETVWESRS